MNMEYINHYENAVQLFTFENNTDKAIREYKKAIKLKPDYAQAYYDLGYIYNMKNQLKTSIKYYKTYLSLNPHAKDKDEIKNTINVLNSSYQSRRSVNN